MTCRLTNDQLQSQVIYHRTQAAQGLTYTHSARDRSEQSALYSATQETLAELYEELLTRRLASENTSSNAA